MCAVLSEDLSKSEDKEDMMKKEGEDGRGAKKADDPEVNSAFIATSAIFVCIIFEFADFSNLKLAALSLP